MNITTLFFFRDLPHSQRQASLPLFEYYSRTTLTELFPVTHSRFCFPIEKEVKQDVGVIGFF
jgi:hypothetical protein